MSNTRNELNVKLAETFKSLELEVTHPKYWKDAENNDLAKAVSRLFDVTKHLCTHGNAVVKGSDVPEREKLRADLGRILKLLGYKGVQ